MLIRMMRMIRRTIKRQLKVVLVLVDGTAAGRQLNVRSITSRVASVIVTTACSLATCIDTFNLVSVIASVPSYTTLHTDTQHSGVFRG